MPAQKLKQFLDENHVKYVTITHSPAYMTQLRDFPFDELKVDRGFVNGATSDKTLKAIYLASLGLAKQLDMTVVAEGVENLQDWQLLRDTGCDIAQGYFIAKPMPAELLPQWIEEWQLRKLALVS